MNNAQTRIDLALDCIRLWETISRFKSYKSEEVIKELQAEYYEKIHKLIRYEYETERGYHECKYCGDTAEGTDEDILCEECQRIFGHTRFSDL